MAADVASDTDRADTEVADAAAALSFAQHLHGHVFDQIRFADQKATVLLGVTSAVLALLYRAGLHDLWLQSRNHWTASACVSLVAILLDGTALAYALLAVLPRLRPASPRRLAYWRAVAGLGSSTEYSRAVLALPQSELACQLLEDCHALSVVCARKFRLLSASFWVAAGGLATSALLVVLK